MAGLLCKSTKFQQSIHWSCLPAAFKQQNPQTFQTNPNAFYWRSLVATSSALWSHLASRHKAIEACEFACSSWVLKKTISKSKRAKLEWLKGVFPKTLESLDKIRLAATSCICNMFIPNCLNRMKLAVSRKRAGSLATFPQLAEANRSLLHKQQRRLAGQIMPEKQKTKEYQIRIQVDGEKVFRFMNPKNKQTDWTVKIHEQELGSIATYRFVWPGSTELHTTTPSPSISTFSTALQLPHQSIFFAAASSFLIFSMISASKLQSRKILIAGRVIPTQACSTMIDASLSWWFKSWGAINLNFALCSKLAAVKCLPRIKSAVMYIFVVKCNHCCISSRLWGPCSKHFFNSNLAIQGLNNISSYCMSVQQLQGSRISPFAVSLPGSSGPCPYLLAKSKCNGHVNTTNTSIGSEWAVTRK